MPPTPPEGEDRAAPSPGKLMIPLSLCDEPPNPVRKRRDDESIDRLAAHMSEHGQTDPIQVILRNGRYTVVGGWTRYLAAQLLGWKDIWANIREDILSAYQMAREDFLANDLHTPLTRLEQAELFNRATAMNPSWTHKQVALDLGVTQTKFSRGLALFQGAIDPIKAALAECRITGESACLVAKLAPELQMVIADKAKERPLKHRVVVKLIKELKPRRGRSASKFEAAVGVLQCTFRRPDPDAILADLRRMEKAVLDAIRRKMDLRNLSELLRDDDGPKAA